MIPPTDGSVAQKIIVRKAVNLVKSEFYNVSVDYSTKKPAVKLPANKTTLF